jgi:hypothetical protein
MKMSDGPRHLTPDDPLTREEMGQLDIVEDAYGQVARRMLGMELEKVQLLAAGRRLTDQKKALFDRILTSRGLDPQTPVQVDERSHKLIVLKSLASEESGPKE